MVLAGWATGLPTFVFLLVAGHWLLGIFGKDFTGAYDVLALLALSQLLIATVGAIGATILSMTGHQWSVVPLVVSSAALSLVLTLRWTPLYGAIGAASATLTAAVFRAAGTLFLVRKHVHIWARPGW
jgi:O-antigen/teichoic acid export membrane protein